MSHYSTIQGHFDGSSVVLDEPASLMVGQKVQVVIDSESPTPVIPSTRRSLAGFAKGMFEMKDDFNEPLDGFAEYV